MRVDMTCASLHAPAGAIRRSVIRADLDLVTSAWKSVISADQGPRHRPDRRDDALDKTAAGAPCFEGAQDQGLGHDRAWWSDQRISGDNWPATGWAGS